MDLVQCDKKKKLWSAKLLWLDIGENLIFRKQRG